MSYSLTPFLWLLRFAFIAVLTCVAPLAAQEIVLSNSTHVNAGLDGNPLVEPHLAVHPGNPEHLLAAVMVSVPEEELAELRAGITCSALLSLDAGETWERHDFRIRTCYDPWVVLLPDGRAVFTALGAHPSFGEQRRLLVFHSSDGGRSWREPTELGTGHDHETIVVDTNSPGRETWIYVVSSRQIRAEYGRPRYTVSVSRSRNGGENFDPAVLISPNNLLIKAETAVVLSDGTLVVSFVEAGHARDSRIDRLGWVVESRDGGASFSKPRFVTEACGPPPVFSISFLAAGITEGKFQDRLYFACNELGGGAVVVSASSDAGETWTDPVRVHSSPADTSVLRQVRAVAVSSRGVLGVVWTDRVEEDRCYEVYFSASVDGGLSFLPEHRISNGRSCPEAAANGRNIRSWPTGGDYFGLAATSEGSFRIMWAEPHGGPFQLWTRLVNVQPEPDVGSGASTGGILTTRCTCAAGERQRVR